jgi:hypothetical protein
LEGYSECCKDAEFERDRMETRPLHHDVLGDKIRLVDRQPEPVCVHDGTHGWNFALAGRQPAPPSRVAKLLARSGCVN